MYTLNAVSLFSGGGGLDLGMEAVGFSTLFASDIDVRSCETLTTNRDESVQRRKYFLNNAHIFNSCVEDIEAQFILQKLNMGTGDLDLLTGGPPCQSFSISGHRKGRQDPRGNLVFDYIRLLDGLRPKSFIFENVSGFMTVENGKLYEEVIKLLKSPSPDLEYTLSIHQLNAVNFGVPQYRNRIFIIGHRDGVKINQIPQITSNEGLNSYLPRYRTVRDGLRNLPPIESIFPANHTGRKHSQRIIDRYANLKPGERDPKTRINKLDLNRPSYTIVVGSDKGGGKGNIHPTEPREVTPRESARMQTFPDSWAFQGNRTRDPIRQIGNAVPPLLAAAIGNEIRHHIFGLDRVPFSTIIDLLGQNHLFDKHEIQQIDALLATSMDKSLIQLA